MNLQRLEHVRIVLALLAAVMTGGAALYGVYSKARGESRRDTAASYETLAPEVNELKGVVQALQEENRQLRDLINGRAASHRPRPSSSAPTERPASPPETSPAPPERRPGVLGRVEDKVPIDFDKAIEAWKRIEELRKKREQ